MTAGNRFASERSKMPRYDIFWRPSNPWIGVAKRSPKSPSGEFGEYFPKRPRRTRTAGIGWVHAAIASVRNMNPQPKLKITPMVIVLVLLVPLVWAAEPGGKYYSDEE